jgi:hypothetical protein
MAATARNLERIIMSIHSYPAPHLIPTIDHLAPPALSPRQPTRAAPPRPALLRITRGLHTGTLFALRAGITTVGRHADCDIVIPDTTMSRRHAVFHHLGDAISVTDLDSFNGTYVNRRIVNQAALADGDEIWIGKLRLILDWVSPPGAQVLSITRVHEVTCPRTGSTRCPLDAASMHSASS